MEDMPDNKQEYPRIAMEFPCKQHIAGLSENTKAVELLTETVKFGFRSGSERMDGLKETINHNHLETIDRLDSHGKRIDTLELDVWLTRKVKIAFYWIGGFSGFAAAILWISGPLKTLIRTIIG